MGYDPLLSGYLRHLIQVVVEEEPDGSGAHGADVAGAGVPASAQGTLRASLSAASSVALPRPTILPSENSARSTTMNFRLSPSRSRTARVAAKPKPMYAPESTSTTASCSSKAARTPLAPPGSTVLRDQPFSYSDLSCLRITSRGVRFRKRGRSLIISDHRPGDSQRLQDGA